MSNVHWQAMVAGIGGQGVLFATRVLAEAALNRGSNVLVSEIHGMAQRGGSVVSHLKVGNFHSPLIASGCADLVFALELQEAIRNIGFLTMDGNLVINAPSIHFLSPGTRSALERYGVQPLVVDADGLAFMAGNPRAANVVLLGAAAAAGMLPFSHQELLGILDKMTTPEQHEITRKLFELSIVPA